MNLLSTICSLQGTKTRKPLKTTQQSREAHWEVGVVILREHSTQTLIELVSYI